MSEQKILKTAERLTLYAIERQAEMEQHQPEGVPSPSKLRRFWTNAILQGMARLEGLTPDPKWMEQFDQRLETARGCAVIETLPVKEQATLILDLTSYVSAMEDSDGDWRQQIVAVRDLMKDICTYPPWFPCRKELERSICSMTDTLMRMTAQKPIRFTHLTLSGYPVPCTNDFVSGIVKDEEAIKAAELYQNMRRCHPKMRRWNASSTIYVGGNGDPFCGVIDATDFDMRIIREDEYRFLKQPGLCAIDHAEIYIPVDEMICALKIEPGKAPEIVTMPNTLEAFQAAVGGYIEVVGLDANAALVCNEEGKLIGLPTNRQVGVDTIAGTFLIVGSDDGEFCSLADADMAHYAERFAQPMPSYGSPEEPTQWEFHVF